MNCPNCGAENNPEATFCGLCHTTFVESQEPRKYPAPASLDQGTKIIQPPGPSFVQQEKPQKQWRLIWNNRRVVSPWRKILGVAMIPWLILLLVNMIKHLDLGVFLIVSSGYFLFILAPLSLLDSRWMKRNSGEQTGGPIEQSPKSPASYSDTYYRPLGSYGSTTRPGSFTPRKARVYFAIVSVLLLSWLVVYFAIIRPQTKVTYVTYRSSKSALTFKYPNNGQQVDLAMLESRFGNASGMSNLSPSMASQYFDTAFMGPNTSKPGWMIVAMRGNTNLASLWDTSKDKEIWLRQQMLETQSQAESHGVTVSSVKTGDIKVGNDDGVTVEFIETKDGTSAKAEYASAVILHNGTTYEVTFNASPNQPAFDNCWGAIEKSIGFYR